ncbi:hypothetical protein Tco_1018882 [Tanacetum coccineum]|uniref:Retrotransposon gag domain-containing protein n=1 Tax=Tanacetum coccineum TaxID=301880 RepID=A0ABQ5FY15_9ASTR
MLIKPMLRSSAAAAARPAGGFRADYGFVATMDRQIRRDPERYVGYGITDSWDEIVETLQGAPVSTDTELGAHMREFESMVRRDTDEIYTRLDDEQGQRQLLAGRVNMLFRDRRTHAHTRQLMETEAGMSREAWGRAMDASDLAHGGVISLRTTVHAQMSEITELQSADRRRQRAMSDLLETDRRRREEMRELRAADRTRQQQIIQTLTAVQTLQRETIPIQGLARGSFFLHARATSGHWQQFFELTLALIDQGVAAAMAEAEASRVGMATIEMQLAKSNSLLALCKMMLLHGGMPMLRPLLLKKMMTDKYCPRGEIKKIETEMWNLKVKGTDVVAYSRRFQQLALMCSRMFPEEVDKIEKYIGGLPDMILGSVKASKSKTMQEVIEFTTELMEDKTHAYAERQAERKRKNDDLSKNNQNQQNKRQNTSQAYTAGNSGRKSYAGSKPLCSKCNYNHEELGSFDAIIGMDWLAKYQAVNVTRLNIISCTKTQKYMEKGFPIFLAHVTTKEGEDESEKKRLEDVPIVQDFPEVFPEDLPGLPPTRQVEFQLNLVPGDCPVASERLID